MALTPAWLLSIARDGELLCGYGALLERDEKPLPIDDVNSDGGEEMNTINFQPCLCFSENRFYSMPTHSKHLFRSPSHCETASAGGSQDSSFASSSSNRTSSRYSSEGNMRR